MKTIIIAAIGDNGLLGLSKDGKHSLPWRISKDMKHFAHSTQGAPVIMGRTTWESLPEKYRPLPGRANIVLSRDQNYTLPEGARGLTDIGEATRFAKGIAEKYGKDVWIMGGASIYEQALGFVDELRITRVDMETIPDIDPSYEQVFFPEFEESFVCNECSNYLPSEEGPAYRFETWARK